MVLLLSLGFLLFLVRASPTPSLALYGLFPPSSAADASSRRASLLSAASSLPSLAGVELSVPADALLDVPVPRNLDVSGDDRVSVPARMALLTHAQRSWADLGDRRAVALYLAHVAAWQRLVDSDAPAALIILDPATVVVDGGAGAPPTLMPSTVSVADLLNAAAEGGGGGGSGGSDGGVGAPPWQLLLLSSVVPPTATLAPADPSLARAGYRVPLNWRSWDAYVLTRRGAQALLASGALPMTARVEAHTSALVALGVFSALWKADGSFAVRREPGVLPAEPGSAATELGVDAADDVPLPSLRALVFEESCDLCALPQDYSRMDRYMRVSLPGALLGFALALGSHYLGSAWCSTRRASGPLLGLQKSASVVTLPC